MTSDYSHGIMHCKLNLMILMLLLVFSTGAKADKLSEDLNAAVVYAYFRVGDDDRDVPGISTEDFKAQIAEMTDPENGYNPLSLSDILKAQDNNSPLPDRSINLTFEGSDSSFIRNAFPLLEEHSIPFTLFISPGLIDQGEKINDVSVLTWDDVKKIAKSDFATIGMTSYSYTRTDGKSVATLAADINHARERYREQLEQEPKFFSYPYGEYTPNFLSAISKQGFLASFGQQSGAIGKSSPRMSLPRFTMTDDFSDIERFRLTATSLPFPVADVEPSTPMIDSNPPHPGFTAAADIPVADLKKIKCFASGVSKIDIQTIGTRRFEIRFANGFEDSKGRLNCTLPAPPIDGSDDPRWRWLGFQFTVPDGI